MRQIIQLVDHEGSLVALCSDGTVWKSGRSFPDVRLHWKYMATDDIRQSEPTIRDLEAYAAESDGGWLKAGISDLGHHGVAIEEENK